MDKKQRHFEFPFRKSYAWTAQITVDLPEELGSERRVLQVNGEKTIEFYSIEDPDRAALKLINLRLSLSGADLVLRRPGFQWMRQIRIPELIIGSDTIDLKGSEGFVDLHTGAFTLQFTIRLTPAIVPLLEQYQVKELPVLVQEAGRLDLGEGTEYNSWLRFSVAPEYSDKFQFGSWSWKSSCKTETMICATLDGSSCKSPGTVYICPGDDVHLWWESSDDVKQASISPNVGSVSPSGHIVVHPTSPTDYTITVQGECKCSAKVHVHVVKEGDIIDIAALPTPSAECWQYDMPETLCSKSIRITSISPQCGLGCFVHQPPILKYPYLNCGGGAICDGLWSVLKKDPNGHLHSTTTGSAYTGPLRVDLKDWPFAGTWQFWPLAKPYKFQGNAYFRLTAKCVKP